MNEAILKLRFGRPTKDLSAIEAVGLYGKTEFESASRSTVPLLAMLIHHSDVFEELVTELNMPDDSEVFLEYSVSPPKGRGKSSFTDVMVIAGGKKLAIEAKWTEPPYDTVAKWLGKGSNRTNREDVLDGWICLIQKTTNRTLNWQDFLSCTYQVVHRAASAVSDATHPQLAYFLFQSEDDPPNPSSDEIKSQLKDVHSILGNPIDFPFFVVDIKFKESQQFRELRSHAKCEATSELVCCELQSSTSLFDRIEYRIMQI